MPVSRSSALIPFLLTLTVLTGCSGDRPRPVEVAANRGQMAGAREAPAQAAPATNPGASERRALLVGVTRYDRLPESRQLQGPANDVALLRRLLVEQFGFPEGNITVLTEAGGDAEKRPTRANIERAFRQLAEAVKPGDQVVVLLAGHGSQQPERDPPRSRQPEPDGLDETFLPADIGAWDGKAGTVANAILDDELGAWLRTVTSKQAFVWFVADACHSGTMTRGTEVTRNIPAEVLVPAAELVKARERAGKRGEATRGEPAAALKLPDAGEYLAALYACRADQVTPEGKYGQDGTEEKFHGLLTYTLCEMLAQSATPLTYRELGRRIVARYAALGRSSPTPLVEGAGRDREVLRTKNWPGRSALVLAADDDGFKVNRGLLHGLTPGSILAVYPVAGSKDVDQVLGHVHVTNASITSARVAPCAHGGRPAVAQLPAGGRCEVVVIDYGWRRLRLAVDVQDEAARRRLTDLLKPLAEGQEAVVKVVTAADRADWLLRLEGSRLVLVPAAGELQTRGVAPHRFGSNANADSYPAWLKDNLLRIVRARGLLSAAGFSESEQTRGVEDGVQIKVEPVRLPNQGDRPVQVLNLSEDRTVRPGDRIAFRIHNPNPFAVHVTLLYVSSDYRILAYWPERESEEDNRIPAGRTVTTPVGNVGDKTLGVEHLVVIAVKAQRDPVDFTCLEQPSLDRARGQARGALDSPLGRLLTLAAYGEGGTRSLTRAEVAGHAMRILTWEVLPRIPGKP